MSSFPHRWTLPVRLGFLLLISLLIVSSYGISQGKTRGRTASFTRGSFALPGGHVVHSSPTIADLDGDGQDEILVGTTRLTCKSDGSCSRTASARVVVMESDGTILWSRDVGAPINSSPSVGNIDGDSGGTMEVVVTTGGDVYDRQTPGAVIAFDRQGNELWRFGTRDHFPVDGYGDGIFSTPALCDVEGDGDLEIAFGSWDQRIYLLDHNGSSLWNNIPGVSTGPGFFNADTVWSSPACADLNGDGLQEIIIGADITGGGVLPDGTAPESGGFVYVLAHDGRMLVRRWLPEAVYSSPAVGDLNGDGSLEITVGTGWFWWNERGRTDPSYVYTFDTSHVFSSLSYADPAKLPPFPGWPQRTDYPGFSSPALADLDGDGDLEVIIASQDPYLNNDAAIGDARIHAWHHNGQPVAGWPIHPKDPYGKDAFIYSSPIVADADGDGAPEILFAMLWDVQVYNANGSFQEYLSTSYTLASSPTVADTDGDNQPEVWIGGSMYTQPGQGHMWRFESSNSGSAGPYWPMFHLNPRHTGRLSLPLRVEPVGGPITAPAGASGEVRVALSLYNSTDNPMEWAVDSLPDRVTVQQSSGSLKPKETATLRATVTLQGLPAGSHDLDPLVFGERENGEISGIIGRASLQVFIYRSRAFLPVQIR